MVVKVLQKVALSGEGTAGAEKAALRRKGTFGNLIHVNGFVYRRYSGNRLMTARPKVPRKRRMQ